MEKIAIIGAGFTGLLIANKLKNLFQVTIFEKSRGVGGRISTRYEGDYEFDHGAQFFYTKDQDFINFTQDLLNKGIVKRWDGKFVEFDSNKMVKSRDWHSSFPHFVGVPKMNSIAKYLANNLDIKLNTKITRIDKHNNKWQLFTSNNMKFEDFDWLIIAIPVAQAQEIINSYSRDIVQLDHHKMSACYALMLGLQDHLELNFDAALVKNSDISWISVNSAKPMRQNKFSMVILSTNSWADANIEQDKNFVTNHLLHEASYVMNRSLNQVGSHIDLHKWRYANAPKVDIPSQIFREPKLILAGDWTIKGVLEGAFLSASNICRELGIT